MGHFVLERRGGIDYNLAVKNAKGGERMRTLKTVFLAVLSVVIIAGFAFAGGDAAKGKALFGDPKFAGGTSGKSCASCHPDGKGVEHVAGKTEFVTPGGKTKTIEEAVNICITMALKGKKLDAKSQEMMDVVAYMNSLGGKPAAAPAKKKKSIEGC
jgi:hypothetical protein